MPFTQDDLEKIKAWIGDHCGAIRCFMCGAGQWDIQADNAVLPVFYDTSSGRIHYMGGVPLVALVCRKCGHTVFFSTQSMGFIPQPPPEAAEAAEAAAEEGDREAAGAETVQGDEAPTSPQRD